MNTLNFNNRFSLFALLLGTLLCLNSCKGDDDTDPCINCEEELITTLTLNFTAPDGAISSFSFRDTDGPGGNAPTVDDIQLAANTSYQLQLGVLDESKTPAEDIATEIKEEDEDHLFIFTSTIDSLVVTATDMDSNGKPLGLLNTAVCGDADSGTLKVVLKHQPDKDAADPSVTGDTDIEATFNVTIQ